MPQRFFSFVALLLKSGAIRIRSSSFFFFFFFLLFPPPQPKTLSWILKHVMKRLIGNFWLMCYILHMTYDIWLLTYDLYRLSQTWQIVPHWTRLDYVGQAGPECSGLEKLYQNLFNNPRKALADWKILSALFLLLLLPTTRELSQLRLIFFRAVPFALKSSP